MRELDPLLHSQLRLAIMSILLGVESADFVYLRTQTESTAGNLSIQIEKLSEAEYINVVKYSDGGRSRTICSITDKGRDAMAVYAETLRSYLKGL